MRRYKVLLPMVAMFLLLACAPSAFKATYDSDPQQDFSGYQTYAWISEHPMKVGASANVVNPLLEQRIMTEIERALAAKGYRKVEPARSADFVVAFTVGSREEIKVDSYPTMSGGVYGRPAHWGWGAGYYGYGTETRVRQYTKGMLAVDVFDVAGRRPVWHGVTEKKINEADRKDAAGTIRAAVDSVLTGFPPHLADAGS